MTDHRTGSEPSHTYLKPEDVAARWNVTTEWLAKLRHTGAGPCYTKISHKKILYALEDIHEYEQKSRRRSTSGDRPH